MFLQIRLGERENVSPSSFTPWQLLRVLGANSEFVQQCLDQRFGTPHSEICRSMSALHWPTSSKVETACTVFGKMHLVNANMRHVVEHHRFVGRPSRAKPGRVVRLSVGPHAIGSALRG